MAEENEVAAVDELKRQTGTFIVEMLSPELSPQVVAARRFERIIASVNVHPSKMPKAMEIVREHSPDIINALRCCDYGRVSGLLDAFDVAYRFAGLQVAVVEPTQHEKWAPSFERWGWGSEEMEGAFLFVKPCEKIESVDWNGFGIAGRRITREQVRLGLRPRWSKVGDSMWLAQFPPIRPCKPDANGDMVFEGPYTART